MKSVYQKPVLDMAATGAKIKNLMGERGISVRDLQSLFNFPYAQAIYNWLSGKNMPTIDNLVVLAQVFDVRIDDLIATRTVQVELDDEAVQKLSA